MSSHQVFMGSPVVSSISTFDRLIFKGHLTGMTHPGAVMATLGALGLILLKDWKTCVEPLTKALEQHLERWCTTEGRPFLYLQGSHTHRDRESKEAIARGIAATNQITQGLVCILRVLEPAPSFDVRGNRASHKLEVVRRRRCCLHYYAYIIDPEFGWMHIRIQSWVPFTMQIYVNGREWLCRQLDRRGVGYRRSDNKIIAIDDARVLACLTRTLERKNWPKVLDRWAKQVNPLLPRLTGRHKNGGYYWVTDQCEYATDLMFRDRATVDRLMPDLRRHAHTTCSVRDCFRFLGKRESKTEAVIDLKQRPEGWRIKFRVGRNSVKIYDHVNIIRIETTINHPAAFRVVRHEDTATTATNQSSSDRKGKSRRKALRKGVIDFWLLARVAGGCNQRMIDSCDVIRTTQAAIDHLDKLARPKTVKGRRVPRLNALDPETITIFKAVADGVNCLQGISNRHIQSHVYNNPTGDPKERRRRTCRITRRIGCLRGHGLIAKIPNANRYRLTRRGRHVIHAILTFHDMDYPILNAA